MVTIHERHSGIPYLGVVVDCFYILYAFYMFYHFSIVLFLPFVAAERGWGPSQFWVFVELLLFCCGLCAFGLQFLNNDTLSERKE